jgi:hypothetical protein
MEGFSLESGLTHPMGPSPGAIWSFSVREDSKVLKGGCIRVPAACYASRCLYPKQTC